VIVEDFNPDDERSRTLVAKAVEFFNQRPLSRYDSKGEVRLEPERNAKGIIGTLAEVWFDDLLQSLIANNPSLKGRIRVTSEAPVMADGNFDQVDFRTTKTLKDSDSEAATISDYTTELRSSLPFYSVHEALFRNFNVIGPYYNDRKKSEIVKDFYAFMVFDLHLKDYPALHLKTSGGRINYSATATNILANSIFGEDCSLKAEFSAYFIGGATKAMIQDESIAENTALSNASYTNERGSFTAIKIINALDAPAFLRRLLGLRRTP
jgi:hypothetical protein